MHHGWLCITASNDQASRSANDDKATSKNRRFEDLEGGVPERLDVEQWYKYLVVDEDSKQQQQEEDKPKRTCYTFPTVFIPVDYDLAMALKKNCERFRKGSIGVQLDPKEQKLLDEVFPLPPN